MNEKLEEYLQEVIGWLDISMRTGRYSTMLVAQLVEGMRTRTLHVHCIYDAIRELEFGPEVRTKFAEPLSRPLLKGFWHKHYFQPKFLLQNIRLGANKLEDEDTEKIFPTDRVPPGKRVGYLVQKYLFAALDRRLNPKKKRADREKLKLEKQKPTLTGEWIIFAKTPTGNCYLTLGVHGEDEAIADRLRSLKSEFPDILELSLLG